MTKIRWAIVLWAVPLLAVAGSPERPGPAPGPPTPKMQSEGFLRWGHVYVTANQKGFSDEATPWLKAPGLEGGGKNPLDRLALHPEWVRLQPGADAVLKGRKGLCVVVAWYGESRWSTRDLERVDVAAGRITLYIHWYIDPSLHEKNFRPSLTSVKRCLPELPPGSYDVVLDTAPAGRFTMSVP